MKPNRIYGLTLGLSALVVAMIFLPVLEAGLGSPGPLGLFTRAAFQKVCHQDPARSLQILGVALPVCARCTGLYTGFFLGFLIWRFFPQRLRDRALGTTAILLGLAPMIIDGVLNAAHLVSSPAGARLATGLLFGAVAARALWPALLEAGAILGKLAAAPARDERGRIAPPDYSRRKYGEGK